MELLPNEMIELILSFITHYQEMINLSRTSRLLHSLIREERWVIDKELLGTHLPHGVFTFTEYGEEREVHFRGGEFQRMFITRNGCLLIRCMNAGQLFHYEHFDGSYLSVSYTTYNHTTISNKGPVIRYGSGNPTMYVGYVTHYERGRMTQRLFYKYYVKMTCEVWNYEDETYTFEDQVTGERRISTLDGRPLSNYWNKNGKSIEYRYFPPSDAYVIIKYENGVTVHEYH